MPTILNNFFDCFSWKIPGPGCLIVILVRGQDLFVYIKGFEWSSFKIELFPARASSLLKVFPAGRFMN